MNKQRTFSPSLIATLIAVHLFAAAANGQAYSLVDLGPLTTATDINDNSQILGYQGSQPVVWELGNIQELLGLDGNIPRASSINNHGQVVGQSDNQFIETRAVIWNTPSSAAVDLGDIVNNDSVSLGARDINDAGQIVGTADSNSAARAFVWDNGSMSELTGQGTANAINNSNAIAGVMYGEVATHAFLINSQGTLYDLGDLTNGEGVSFATDLNGSDQVVGSSLTVNGTTHAFVATVSGMTDLGDLPGGSDQSRAHRISDAGTVVGRSASHDGDRAFVWNPDAGILDLNGIVNGTAHGWVLQSANGINSVGQIVGSGLNPDGEQRGFLLRLGLACDFNADSQCNASDLNVLYTEFGETSQAFDLNGDAIVNVDDADAWLALASDPANPHSEGYRVFRRGDVNLNGSVDSSDLGILLNNFGDTLRKGFDEGNLNGDDHIDSTDLGLLLNEFGFASSPSFHAVPEPSVHVFVILAIIAFVQAVKTTHRK